MSRGSDGRDGARGAKGGRRRTQNLRANKELRYTEGEVIYVQNLRVLDSQNVLSQFQKLNYLKTHTQNNKRTKTKTQSPSLVTVYSFFKNPFPVN